MPREDAAAESPPVAFIRIDADKLGSTLSKLIIALGLIAVYVLLLAAAAALVGVGLKLVARVIPTAIPVVLAVPALLVIWTITFITAIEGLEECGIELGRAVSWALFPIAFPLAVVVLATLVIAGLADHCPRRLKYVCLVVGSGVALAVAASLALLLLQT
jgi:hypothetical protein